MKKIVMVVLISFVVLFSVSCYGEETNSSLDTNKEEKKNVTFDPDNNLTSLYARGKILSGKTKKNKNKKNIIELSYTGDEEPFMAFSNFLLDGPSNVYSGFTETIFYRDGIKVKDIYYESDEVKTDKVGIFFTNLSFVSEEGDQYIYKHVPYMVLNDEPTLFFSDITFNKEGKTITGSINIPKKDTTYYIELFYLDNNEEYSYQEVEVKNNGKFKIKMSRDGTEENMYLRVNDGFGNYGDACSVLQKESTKYESLEVVDKSVVENNKISHLFSKQYILLIELFLVDGSFILAILIKRVMEKQKNLVSKK